MTDKQSLSLKNKQSLKMKSKLTKKQLGSAQSENYSIYSFSKTEKKILDRFRNKLHSDYKKENIEKISDTSSEELKTISQENYKNKTNKKLFYYRPIITNIIGDSISSFSPRLSIFDNIFECFFDDNIFYKPDQESKLITKSIDEFSRNPFIYLPKKDMCKKYDSEDVINILIRNSKKKYLNPEIIICPQQIQSNCWFNTGLMIYFFSDLGKKFNRYLRDVMIRGKISKKIIKQEKIKKILFIFNLYIEACIQGEKFCTFIDTNYLIREIYKLSLEKNILNIINEGEPGNPQIFYNILVNHLLDIEESEPRKLKITIGLERLQSIQEVLDILKYEIQFINYEIIVICIHPPNLNLNPKIAKNKSFHHFLVDEKKKTTSFNKTINNKPLTISLNTIDSDIVYNLDSLLLRSIDKNHFCCCITINNEYYLYDGASYSKLKKFNWNDNLNNDSYWYFEKDINEINPEKNQNFTTFFNFLWGYQELYYYRI